MAKQWFLETLHGGTSQGLEIQRKIFTRKTPFQDMQIFENETFGRTLVLDGVVQTTERDEFIYHEMMAHIPIMAHPNPKDVLIIGGGDGGVAREALRHPSVKKVVMVEIDEGVITACQKHLPSISKGAFEDERLHVIIDDGAAYVRTTPDKFDVVVIDSPDPVGPAMTLFAIKFYRGIDRVLREGGIVIRQAGSTFLQASEMKQTHRRMKHVFEHVNLCVTAIPTYVGGFFGLLVASHQSKPFRVTLRQLEARYDKARLSCQYYNPAMHLASLSVPNHVKALLKTS